MASDIFSQLIAAFWKLFALFYERRAVSEGLCEQNMIAVQIKYASNRESIILTLNKDWTVADVKRRVVDEINKQRNETKLSEQEIAIIFAGRELNDCVAMNECDLGNNSILHAVKIKNKTNMNATSTNGTNTLTEAVISLSLVDHQLTSQTEHKHENHSTTGSREKRTYFFVFCSSCKDIKSGKLRVRCAKCKENSLVVARDPVCWNDVLSSGRITGKCHSGQCNGSIAEFYFKCSGEHLNGEAVILYLLRHNNREIPCLACTGVHEVVLVFSCAHKHVICYQCFKIYCLTKLNDRQFVIDPNIGYTLACAVGCEDSLIKETHHFRIMGEEAYNKYQRFAAEECLLQSGGVLCPQPNCGAGIFMEYDDDIDPDLCNRVVCGSCNYAFCRICSQGYHIGDCARDELLSLDSKLTLFNSSINVESAKKSKWENDAELSLKTIRSTTKPCPKCRTPVERNGGCMHMRCTRPGCGFNWCWLCQTEWTRDCMADHWFN